MPLNSQHKRVHKNRVSITYDIDTDGATQSRELPFVVGVIADLSGHRPDDQKDPIEDRQFIRVDQDNFDQVISRLGPVLSLSVENTLEEEGAAIACELAFNSMADFDPGNIVQQVPALNELLTARNRLKSLLGKSDRCRDLEKALRQVIGNNELMEKLADELDIGKE
ncbi:type VI secretion system contractile sheath small subunit [Endozoicomonas sp.]|uniref:type VI secretion system contractile sheath small subunit n=1 Tax=Endozoicomonas sp. TaxID=1892382 RepID=UPI002888A101|nr:type VI secretion system contractile sheath small subunit [Endozoicomonas sp.]